MLGKKNFLPSHPKIVKKLHPHSLSTSFLDDNSVEEERIADRLIDDENNKIAVLQTKILMMKEKNQNVKTALQFYQPQVQIQSIRSDISKLKAQESELMQKIKNCETVERTTTVEEYYLWQKKQLIEDHEEKVELIADEYKDEKDRLNECCEETRRSIEETQTFMREIVAEMGEMQKVKVQSENVVDEPINPETIANLKLENSELISTVELLRENHNILTNQVIDNIQSNEMSLKASFDTFKTVLIKDLLKIKEEINEGEVIPPTHEQKQFKSDPLIKQYRQKMREFSVCLDPSLKEMVTQVLEPMDFESFNWRSYLEEEQKKEGNEEEQYKKIEQQYINNENEIRDCQDDLKQVINETVIYQQKNHELQSAIHKIIQLGLTLSPK